MIPTCSPTKKVYPTVVCIGDIAVVGGKEVVLERSKTPEVVLSIILQISFREIDLLRRTYREKTVESTCTMYYKREIDKAVASCSIC